jgi:hypothetical protein
MIEAWERQERARRVSAGRTVMETDAQAASGSPEEDGDHRYFHVLGPADGTSFFLLGDRSAVLSESTQRIYTLNRTAAYIWCRLEEQAAPEAICGELARFGIGRDVARGHVRAALRSWLKLGLLKIEYSLDIDALPVERSLELDIAGFCATIRVANGRLAGLLTMFEHHPTSTRKSEHIFEVVELNGLVHVLHNKQNAICCEDFELAPSIKAYITDQLVTLSTQNIVFHAACLVRDGKSLLISGGPGAGKTTLALRLAKEGFEYGGDDVVLIGPDGSATGVPFAPAVKSGAWNIVNRFRPDLNEATTHRRPDGKRVRYLTPTHIALPGWYPVGWTIFIKRAPGITTLKPLGPVETMHRLIGGAYSPDEKLSLAKCRAINRALTGANSYELRYSNLAEAANTIVRLCDG